MTGLHPIIRRKRRPLFVEDVPLIPIKDQPVQPVATVPLVEPAKVFKSQNAKSTATKSAS